MGWAEAKWIVDNVKQKTGQAPNNMRNFAALSVSDTQIGLKFLEPSDSYAEDDVLCSVAGVMIRMGEDDYPATPSNGVLVVDNKELGKYKDNAFLVSGLKKGQTYYFSAFPYSAEGVYNLSRDGANRVNTVSTEGEIVTLSISVDDVTDFKAVTVRCVDETDSALTRLVSMSLASNTASMVVPAGHTYHIEWGNVYGYSKPANTLPKTAEAGATVSYEATYEYFTATVDVTYPEGATLTCSLGSKVYTAGNKTGSYQFKVHAAGAWTVRAVGDDGDESTTVEIKNKGDVVKTEIAFVKIYGISRDITSSSPAWARTDEAVGKTVTATKGSSAGHSDFDTCYPWSEIKRETLDTGDVMVKIPKFWFRRYRENNVEHVQIADRPFPGFAIHPAFNHAGVEKDSLYVGAYEAVLDNRTIKSKSDLAPYVSKTRSSFRTEAKAKGTGWGITDIAAVSAIQMLILVEFAHNDVQTKIGPGRTHSSNTATALTGMCDSVTGLTGRTNHSDGMGSVIYRGIENFWGNVWEHIDGINFNNGLYYVCNDPSKYADATSTNYEKMSFTGSSSWSDVFIKEEGLDGDRPHIMLPTVASGASDSTYMCDYVMAPTNGWKVVFHGGGYAHNTKAGLFALYMNFDSSGTDAGAGCRLMYIPQ